MLLTLQQLPSSRCWRKHAEFGFLSISVWGFCSPQLKAGGRRSSRETTKLAGLRRCKVTGNAFLFCLYFFCLPSSTPHSTRARLRWGRQGTHSQVPNLPSQDTERSAPSILYPGYLTCLTLTLTCLTCLTLVPALLGCTHLQAQFYFCPSVTSVPNWRCIKICSASSSI